MTPDELRRRLQRMGYLTHDQAAAALGQSRSAITRMLSGASAIRPHVVRTLELLELYPLPVLSGAMRHALGQAGAPGDVVAYPESDAAHVARVDWDEVYDAMHALDLVDYPDGRPHITERGWRALHWEREAT